MWASGIPIRLMSAMAAILSVGLAKVEIAVIQSPESIRETATDLVNRIAMQSGSHGQDSVTAAPQASPSLPSTRPHDDLNQRAMTPFGSPSPPNQLTPAPVLPFHPNRPLVPSGPPPPTATPHPGSSGGRFGR